MNQNHQAFGLFENLFGPHKPCLADKESPMKNGYLSYHNSEHKVQLQYPSNWQKEEDNGKFTSGSSTLYSLATFQPDTSEGFKSTLELEINDISNYPGDIKSLSGLADFEKENILLSSEARITSSDEIQINGCQAHEIVYTQGIPDKTDEWKIMQTFLVDCNREYVMRYTATDSGIYSQYLDIVSNMVQSFKVEEC